ncbi:hypothetical protein KR084_011142, partial [Drosophila pseudotakahashii]
MIDHRLTYASSRAGRTAAAISRIMANTWGPRQPGRRLLVSVVTSTLMYAAPIWARSTKNESYLQDADSVQRLCALRVCCAFRTVSHDAALVISEVIPIDLLALESVEIRAGSTGIATAEALRKRCRELTIAKWQERWAQSSKGRWTYKLIPELQRWLGQKHAHVIIYLTQLLTGHGCFKYYLNRFKHERYP